MANINLSELHNAGAELFQDSESFLNELRDVDAISGGHRGSYYYSPYAHVSNISTFHKLAEAFIATYAINLLTSVAKSISAVYR